MAVRYAAPHSALERNVITIRSARQADAPILSAIGLLAWEEASAAIGVTEELRGNARVAFESFTQSAWGAITLAECDGAIAGWAARENFDDTITDFWIAPSFQRRGIGSQLLIEVERQITERGFASAKLESHSQNEAAVSFFCKHGYRVSWLSVKYLQKLDREVQSIGLEKQLVEFENESYGFDF